MKTSLGIWAFGNMATRFNPGGYKPELSGASTVDKVRTAVEGLGDDTGRLLGRMTLNPMAHFDLFGTLLLIVAGLLVVRALRVEARVEDCLLAGRLVCAAAALPP